VKANTTELIKFKKLQRKLGESVRGTVGLLEMLWIAVARNCPRGNIGRFSNEDIAILADWEGCPDLLVRSLVECGWLDACMLERLVVHDWQDHAPNYVKGNIKQGVDGFCVAVLAGINETPKDHPKNAPRDTPKDHPKDTPRDMPNEGPCPTPTKSSQVKSEYQAQSEPTLARSELGDFAKSKFLENDEFVEVAKAFREARARKHGNPSEAVVEAWYYSLNRFTVEEAIACLRFSTTCEAKKPLVHSEEWRLGYQPHGSRKTTNSRSGSKKDEVDAILERTFGNAG
jgi:hypothetical protein